MIAGPDFGWNSRCDRGDHAYAYRGAELIRRAPGPTSGGRPRTMTTAAGGRNGWGSGKTPGPRDSIERVDVNPTCPVCSRSRNHWASPPMRTPGPATKW